MAIPDFVSSYVKYLTYRESARNNNKIDLTGIKFLNSTTALLLAVLKIKEDIEIYTSSPSEAANYLNYMVSMPEWWKSEIGKIMVSTEHYIPFSVLPNNNTQFKTLLERIRELINSYDPLGGQNAFNLVLTELTDNIYQHSRFDKAFMMCQTYKKKEYVELSFIDDGISIPGNFNKYNIDFESDAEAIDMAVKGVSTKKDLERGRGLGDSLSVYCKSVNAQAMIVSRGGLYYRKGDEKQLYKLTREQEFQGTLVSLRLPVLHNNIDYTKYVS
jgi:hypothetical protein